MMRALQGEDIVCFSNDWDGDPLSKMHIMRRLARDNRILWVNSLGNRSAGASAHDTARIWKKLRAALRGPSQVEPNLFVYTPLAIPVFGNPATDRINRDVLKLQLVRTMGRLGFSRPLIWAFLPSAQWVATSLDRKLLVYHCVDEFSAFSDAPRRVVAASEERLIRAADLVITSSQRLFERKRQINPHAVLVRHGVDFSHFSKALDETTPIPDDVARFRKPVIGFFGLIADWVDLTLIARVALAHPAASVVLVGAVRTDLAELARLPNVHLLGRRSYASLPGYCRAFDVALVPFRISELTRSANPLKAREYLAAGLPVVSTRIPEVEQIGACRVGDTHAEFLQKLDEALAEPDCRVRRADSVRMDSWDARVEEIRQHIAQLPRAAYTPET
jgi:glycosyltransferase involved in cell wall biosynthesis